MPGPLLLLCVIRVLMNQYQGKVANITYFLLKRIVEFSLFSSKGERARKIHLARCSEIRSHIFLAVANDPQMYMLYVKESSCSTWWDVGFLLSLLFPEVRYICLLLQQVESSSIKRIKCNIQWMTPSPSHGCLNNPTMTKDTRVLWVKWEIAGDENKFIMLDW